MDFFKPLIGIKKGNSANRLSQLKHYLSNLGYMSYSNTNDDTFDDALEQAIRKYQKFFKLPETGTLDANTIKRMSQPRCGVPDFPRSKNHSTPIASSHYTFFPNSPKWAKKNLTYSFPPGTRGDTNKAILDATNIWASVSPFRFTYITDYNNADVKISFQIRDHGDGSPFDGPGNVLAHAFAPSDGRLHFDGDEKWVDGVVGGAFDLQTVGLHELGHVLGLGHSSDGGAVMWPYIGSGIRKGVGQDDINGIKALYPS